MALSSALGCDFQRFLRLARGFELGGEPEDLRGQVHARSLTASRLPFVRQQPVAEVRADRAAKVVERGGDCGACLFGVVALASALVRAAGARLRQTA